MTNDNWNIQLFSEPKLASDNLLTVVCKNECHICWKANDCLGFCHFFILWKETFPYER